MLSLQWRTLLSFQNVREKFDKTTKEWEIDLEENEDIGAELKHATMSLSSTKSKSDIELLHPVQLNIVAMATSKE